MNLANKERIFLETIGVRETMLKLFKFRCLRFDCYAGGFDF